MNGKWISPFRVIPYILSWVLVAFVVVYCVASYYGSIELVPDQYLTLIACLTGLSVVSFFRVYNRRIDNVSNKKVNS